jgi:hypothetical protein
MGTSSDSSHISDEIPSPPSNDGDDSVDRGQAESDNVESLDNRPWSIALVLMIVPGLLLADLLHPAILHRPLFETVNQASSHHYKMLDTLDCLVAAALFGGIAFIGALAIMRKRKLLLRLTALTYCCAIPVGITEAFFQFKAVPMLHAPGMRKVAKTNPEIAPGVSGVSRLTINQLGLRGPNPNGETHRILCVGGSTTFCSYLDDEETWPAVLMQKLNEDAAPPRTWVANAGKNGLDLLHHIEFLKRWEIASKFDVCIVLCGVNDLEHSIRMPRKDRIALAPSRVFDVGGPDYPLTPHFKQAYLYGMFKTAVKRILGFEESDSQADEGAFYAKYRREHQEAIHDYPLPPLGEHLAFYKKSLAELQALCDEKGLRLILLTQPALWRDDLPPELERLLWSRPIGRTGRVLSTEALARGMKAFNDSLREFCAERSVELVDLAAVLPKDESVFYDDEHFNENGARRVAGLIADHFRAQFSP